MGTMNHNYYITEHPGIGSLDGSKPLFAVTRTILNVKTGKPEAQSMDAYLDEAEALSVCWALNNPRHLVEVIRVALPVFTWQDPAPATVSDELRKAVTLGPPSEELISLCQPLED